MLKRFAVVLYIFLNILILFIPISLFLNPSVSLIEHTYQARCIKNGKLVVLQGTIDNSPATYTKSYLNDYRFDPEKDLRFYCNNYDEIQKHIENYKNAKNVNEEIKATLIYREFEKNAPTTNYKNYSLELINTSYSFLWFTLFTSMIYTLGAFLLLQIIRIIYQYIVFGSFTWHPYKQINLKNKS